jgi:hypothetical protein
VVEDCADRAANALLEELDAEEEAVVAKKNKKKKNKKKQQNKKKQEKELSRPPAPSPKQTRQPALPATGSANATGLSKAGRNLSPEQTPEAEDDKPRGSKRQARSESAGSSRYALRPIISHIQHPIISHIL